MSKASDIQETPDWFFNEVNGVYGFVLDICANESNHKTNRWYGPGGEHEDALTIDWDQSGWLWMNPPYSRGNQVSFVDKAIEQAKRGCKTLALLPADTSTRLFHRLYGVYDVEFVRTRLKFNGMNNSAKFGSMLVVIDF